MPDWHRSASLRSSAWPRSAALDPAPTKPSPPWNGSAPPCGPATPAASPYRSPPGERHRRRVSLTRRRPPPHPRHQAVQGAETVEAEADLIEEILRLRGLNSIPPVSLPMPGVVPGPTLTPRQARTALVRRTLAAQGLVECVTFSFMATAEAVCSARPPKPSALPTQSPRTWTRSPHAPGWPRPRSIPQRRPRLARHRPVRDRPGLLRRRPDASSRPASAPAPPSATGPNRPAPSTPWTPRRTSTPRWNSCGADGGAQRHSGCPGFYHPGRSGVVARDRSSSSAVSAPCTPRCSKSSTCPARSASSCSSTRSPNPSDGAGQPRPAGIPAGAPGFRLPGGVAVPADAVLRAAGAPNGP